MATDAIRALTVLALYKAVTTELDKTNVPSFSVEQFNYYANKGQLKYFEDRLDLYAQTQKLTDDLRSMSTRYVYTEATTLPITTGQVMDLPEDYQNLQLVQAWFSATTAFGPFKANTPFLRTAKRSTADMEGYTEAPNHYLKATYNNVFHRLLGTQLHILSGIHSKLKLTKVEIEYLRTPPEIKLYESDVDDLTNDATAVLKWPASCSFDLATYIVKELMEQHGNQRLGNYAAMNQPNNGAAPANPQQQVASRQQQQQPQPQM